VSVRGDQLVEKTQRQLATTSAFLSGLTSSDLLVFCDDDRGGSTIGSVATHLGSGYGQAVRFLQAVGIMLDDPGTTASQGTRSEAYAMVHGGTGHGHGHGHGHTEATVEDLSEMIAQLRLDSESAIDVLVTLSDEQLSLIPPAIGTMSDGRKTLAQVIEDSMDHQMAHLDRMKKSLANSPRSVQETS
jgi:hypothetical protein